MTIIELNIGGLHVTGSATDLQRSWQRSVRAVRRSVKNAHWRPAQLRPRHAAERPAA